MIRKDFKNISYKEFENLPDKAVKSELITRCFIKKAAYILLSISLLISIFATVTSAATYYVDGSCPNNGNGLADQCASSSGGAGAFQTINRAVCGSTDCINSPSTSLAAHAGDTILVKNGTYYQTRTDNNRFGVVLNPANSGTVGNPITIKNYPGHTPLITYANGVTGTGPLIGTDGKNYITWDGFIIQEVAVNNAQDTGPVVISSANDVTIKNCDIRGVSATVTPAYENHNGIRIEGVTNASIVNNKIHGIQGVFHNHAAIMTYSTRNITIQNNEIYDAFSGIFIKGPTACGMTDRNPEDQCAGNAFYTIRNNLIYHTNVGIRTSYMLNGAVYNNIIKDGYQYVGPYTASTKCRIAGEYTMNVDFYNNVCYGWTEGFNISFALGGAGGNDLRNNIFANTTYPLYVASGGESYFTSNNNDFYSYETFRYGASNITFSQLQAAGKDINSITSNPLFVNTSTTPTGFKLQSGSPAINAGVDFGDLDGDGNTTEAINMGAYAFGTETIGTGSTTTTTIDNQAPTIPTSLSAVAVSSSQINLSWTASTDDTAVTGYSIERCNGAICTNFAQVGTSSITSNSNTALTANTTYRYQIKAYDAQGNTSTASVIASTTTLAGASSSPYSGTPYVIPGKVEIENYDIGGEGVAYHDTSTGNAGGSYRADGVDVRTCTDTGGGYNIGWTAAGEWLEYTVNAASAGTYDIEVRVASAGAGGTMHIEIDGVDKTGAMTVPNTGGWQTWQTVTKTGVSLSAGNHIMRVLLDSIGGSGDVGNINFVNFILKSTSDTTPPKAPILSVE